VDSHIPLLGEYMPYTYMYWGCSNRVFFSISSFLTARIHEGRIALPRSGLSLLGKHL